MFFRRKINPVDREKVIEVLRLWGRHMRTLDAATDPMRIAIEEEGIESALFEKNRRTAVEITKELLEEASKSNIWPDLEDEKGFVQLSLGRSSLNELYAQYLDNFRLQKEYVELLKNESATQLHVDSMESLDTRMADQLDELSKSVRGLAKHYKINLNELNL